MIGISVVLISLSAVLVNSLEINIPKDVDFVTITGPNFKLEVNQAPPVQQDWQNIVDESAQVKKDEVSNPSGAVANGFINADLYEWIQEQATALDNKIFRFIETLKQLKPSEQRVVAQVLLLNSLKDLNTLREENLDQLKWIKKKAKAYLVVQEDNLTELEKWVFTRIHECYLIEKSLKGSKNPGNKWLTNVKAVKRILLEQRFSELIEEAITDFLKGKLWDIERSNVFDVFSSKSKIDDGLYYIGSKGLVPPHFPFSAQEAIVNEV